MNFKSLFPLAALAVAAFFAPIAVGQDCSMIPADAQAAGRLNAKELSNNPTLQKLNAQVKNSPLAKNADILKIDEKSIEKCLFYARERGERSAVVAMGTFDIEQVKKGIAANAVQSDGYIAFKFDNPNASSVFVAFPRQGMFIASDKINELKYLSSVLAKERPSLQPQSKIGNAIRGSAPFAMALDKGVFGKDTGDAPEFVTVTAVSQAPGALKLAASAIFADSEVPAKLEEQVIGMKTMFSMMLAQDPKMKAAGVPELLQAIKAKANGKTLNFSLVITEKMADGIGVLVNQGTSEEGMIMVPGMSFGE